MTQEITNFFHALQASFYKRKVEEEVATLGHQKGPLSRIFLPAHSSGVDAEKFKNFELLDPVGDQQNMPMTNQSYIIHKYPNRLLFIPTWDCFFRCQYCFRKDLLLENKNGDSWAVRLHALENYLKDHPEIREVILSGGEPLLLSPSELAAIFERIKRYTSIESLRVHTRMPIYCPSVVNSDLLQVLKDFSVRFVLHIVHPYEICPVVEEVIAKLIDNSIRCYNQFPILRQINDHSEVLIRLLKKLDALSVKTLSLFFPDAYNGSAPFRIPFSRFCRLIDEVNWNTPSWINSVKFTLDTPIGKVQRSDLVAQDPKKHILIFKRGDQTVTYPDWPEEWDEQGELETLLWKG